MFNYIKKIFKSSRPSPSTNHTNNKEISSIQQQEDRRTEQQRIERKQEAQVLETHFSLGDYALMSNSKDFDYSTLVSLLKLIGKEEYYSRCLDNGYEGEINTFNFPGPFYTLETDSCYTGPIAAPDHVMVDHEGYEFVYKQATDFEGLLSLVDAARSESFNGYSCLGNLYWDRAKVREWWAKKDELIEIMKTEDFLGNNGTERVHLYTEYLETKALDDLKMYVYIMENGEIPLSLDALEL